MFSIQKLTAPTLAILATSSPMARKGASREPRHLSYRSNSRSLLIMCFTQVLYILLPFYDEIGGMSKQVQLNDCVKYYRVPICPRNIPKMFKLTFPDILSGN